MPIAKRVEQFSSNDLLGLQCDLQQFDLDSCQATGLLAAFLNGRGYGVDLVLVKDCMLRLEQLQGDEACLQKELERVALVM